MSRLTRAPMFALMVIMACPMVLASEVAGLTKTAEVTLNFDDLKKSGSDAAISGKYAEAVEFLEKAHKINRKDRVVSKLLKEARWQLREMAADAYAASIPPKMGLGIHGILTGPDHWGGGAKLSWQETNPAKMAWGVKLAGWYENVNYAEGGYLGKHLDWGYLYSGRLQATWQPGHGRGVRNRAFFDSGFGLGFIQGYHNVVDEDVSKTAKSDTYSIYRTGLATTVGIGFSSKYGFEIAANATSFYYGGGFDLQYVETVAFPVETSLSLGYLF